ncbi:MAG: FixH family protein [Rhodospirillaceae bacterium]|nr:FixH family protein [Rhodospirillaceae bacterium]
MTTLAAAQRPVTGRTVLFWLLVAFGVITAVNVALIVFALRSFTGETVPKSYATGLDFNRTLEAVAAQRDLGWHVDSSVGAQGTGVIGLRLNYRDSGDLPLSALDVTALISRPTTEGHDFEQPLTHQGDGLYAAAVNVPLPGLWHVRVLARRGETEAYVLDYRVVVP